MDIRDLTNKAYWRAKQTGGLLGEGDRGREGDVGVGVAPAVRGTEDGPAGGGDGSRRCLGPLGRRAGDGRRADGLVLTADLGQQQRAVGADGRPGRSGAAGAGGNRVGGRRLEGVDGSMRAGASVARVVRNLKQRRIKSEARGGSGIAWWEGKVKRDIRCQTGGVLVGSSRPGGVSACLLTYVDMVTVGSCVEATHSAADYGLARAKRETGSDGWCREQDGELGGAVSTRPLQQESMRLLERGERCLRMDKQEMRDVGKRVILILMARRDAETIGHGWPADAGP